ncbi:UNVERIFIED_CONTAM: Bridging integrator 3 [Gekko kuhli]
MAVKRREQALQDYKRLQSKVEKYEEKEKTGPILAKLHQAREELRPVKEDFEAKNKQLLEEMPKFYSSRIDYFKPSFESLIRAQKNAIIEEHRVETYCDSKQFQYKSPEFQQVDCFLLFFEQHSELKRTNRIAAGFTGL